MNTSSESGISLSETLSVSQDTDYPISYYISNGGDIPWDCVYLNYTLTTTSDAGISDAGFVVGGFAIGNSTGSQLLLYWTPDPPEEIFVVFIFVGCAPRTTPLVRTYVHYVARYAMG